MALPGRKIIEEHFSEIRETALTLALSKETAVIQARVDLAKRLGVSQKDVKEDAVEKADFPDMALGAAAPDEMSGQMLTPGWRIRLSAAGKRYEYRANEHQLRLVNFKGANHRIQG
jgi:hypothetical protein